MMSQDFPGPPVIPTYRYYDMPLFRHAPTPKLHAPTPTTEKNIVGVVGRLKNNVNAATPTIRRQCLSSGMSE